MSSGPGTLQNRILSILQDHHAYIFKNVILWDLAVQRSEIININKISKELTTGIIKKSFQENFRRATNRLIENGKIIAEKRKITAITEAFQNFPYLTPDLEIFTLRKKLLPSVFKYIQSHRFSPKFGKSKIEEEIAKKLSKNDKRKILDKWAAIEREIALIMSGCHHSRFELWLNFVSRGRNIFTNSGPKSSWAMMEICSRLRKNKGLNQNEIKTLAEIENLMHTYFADVEWDLGECKKFYYSISDMSKGSSGRLNDEVKRYLHDKHQNFVESLPDHKSPKSHKITVKGKGKWMRYGQHQYSPLLDKLLTKQILRNFIFIKSAG